MTNNWMDDPAVAHIDKAKLDFLQSLVFESQSLTKEQMLPFIMSVAKKGKDNHISFSSEDVATITEAIRKHSTPEELDKIDKLEKLMKQQKR